MKQVTLAAILSAVGGLAGCVAAPTSPLYELGVDQTLAFPDALSRPGSQARVRLTNSTSTVLVWRTEIGFGGTQIRCTHCGCELTVDFPSRRLTCPGGIRYTLDGTLVQTNLRKGVVFQPLRAYVVEHIGNRLKILG